MASAVLRKGREDDDRSIKFETMFKNLMYAYLGNAIGLITIAWLANLGHLPAVPAAVLIAKHKVFDYSAGALLFRAVLGGWLIGLAVWTSQAAEEVSSKFVTIWLCISTYVMCQYEHCLANLFFVPCAIFAGAKITWGQFIMQNLIPTTIGNFIGGFGLLALSYRFLYGRKTYLEEKKLKQSMDVN
jgi:formate/nitrite transporter FocA (FNT family)